MFNRITWRGETRGAIKKLAGFAGHHRLPGACDAAGTDFLRRVGEELVAKHCEVLFRELREAFGYRRRQLVVGAEPGLAEIATPDFTVYLGLEQDPGDLRRYRLVTELTRITRPAALHSPAFATVFEGLFQSVEFATEDPIPVDAVIDRVEELPGGGGVSVDYPPDASHCVVRLRASKTTLHFTPDAITLRSDPGATLADLLEAADRLPSLLE